MTTSTPKANLLGEIRSAETVLFWAERVQILELIFFPAFTNVYPAFISCLWMVISTVINITYGLCFIERQLVRPFSFEPDFVFYAERVGFLFALLNKLGFMEKGMDLGLDILKLTQFFLILRLVILVARSINNLDITEGGDEVIEKRRSDDERAVSEDGSRKRSRRFCWFFGAEFRDCGKQVYLGGFDTAHAATRAYDRAAIKFLGERGLDDANEYLEGRKWIRKQFDGAASCFYMDLLEGPYSGTWLGRMNNFKCNLDVR